MLDLHFDRYSDILVHRALAVAIHADQSYPTLLDKQEVQVKLYLTCYTENPGFLPLAVICLVHMSIVVIEPFLSLCRHLIKVVLTWVIP